MSLSGEHRKRTDSDASSSESVKSDWSKDGDKPTLRSENTTSIKRRRLGSHASSSVSVKSDQSKDADKPNFSENKTSIKRKRSGSPVSSCVSVKSDWSKDGDIPNFSKDTHLSPKRLNHETDSQSHKDSLLGIFQDLEDKIIAFLKTELKGFLRILQKEDTQYFVNDFNENKCSMKESVLHLTLNFLRQMKQDEAANVLEDELFFIHRLKCSLKEKCQCVFEGIAKQGDSTLLNNIYTDLYITQGDSEQVNTQHEVRQIEVASRRHESQEIQVECKQLFEESEQDKKIRTVLTKGVAGIGKSVSVQKFLLDWAEGKGNQEINFIFPLQFREMNLKEKEKLSLMDLITQFFPEVEGLNLTRRNQFKVLFILDGLDEFHLPLNFAGNEMCRDVSSPVSLDVLLMNLIKGNLLPSALIWITSRPAAASKIPPDCIDRLTEIRGFKDEQKEEYFRKRFTDENQAKVIIDHVKKSKSLFIMCHIPVFCWISATVLQNIFEEGRSNGDGASKSRQDTPKTLTQMYAHFLRFQIQQWRRKYVGENKPDVSWDKDTILSLGKLAFHHLERSNMIFYETDLEACDIDVYKASVYSGVCTQIFKKETGIILGSMYCFVHLSVQEFIAALYAHLFLDINKKSVFNHDSAEQGTKNESMIDLLKTAVDKALESDNGHLDLFLRFLLGLSLQSNQQLLQGLLTQKTNKDQIKEEIIQYIKQKFEAYHSPERSINLFHCLNELNDQTLVKEIQTHLSKGSLSSVDLSPAQWSALTFVLLTSEDKLEEFELQKFKKSDECLIRLSAVIKTSKSALLNDCNLTERSCSALATVLGSDTNLKELNMDNNNLQDSGVKLLCAGLENIKCRLEKLSLSNCNVTEEGYKALASALRSNPSHLRELDLRGNGPGQSGVKELSDLLQDSNCQLNTLRFLSPAANEACEFLTGVVGRNPLLLRELNLSGCELGDTRVNQLSALLQDKHCQIDTLVLNYNRITTEGCAALTSAFNCNPSNLIKLNLSGNALGNSGILNICCLLKNTNCRLEKLNLTDCSITEEGYKALALALRSNPSHLKELDLRGNDPGQSGVKKLSDILQDPKCQLNTLRFLSPAADEACQFVSRLMGKNPLLLRKMDLNRCKMLGDTQVNQLSSLLQDKHCQIDTLILWTCGLSEKQCMILTSALKSNPSHLRELDLTGNEIKNTGVNHLCDLLENPHCKLERLRLRICKMTDEGCSAVISALKSNPSHLRELDLSVNKLGESGVKNLKDLLMNPQCKLEILSLCHCSITEKQCMILTSALKSNPSHLKELDLSENKIKNTGVNHLCDLLKDSRCKLEKLRLWDCGITDVTSLTQCLTNTKALKFLKELDLSGNSIEDSKQKRLTEVIRESNCELSF